MPYWVQGWRCGETLVVVVVRALASHQCGPDSIPRLSVICGLSLLVTILNQTKQISHQNVNRSQIDVISPFTRRMKPYRFENAPLLAAFSNSSGFASGLDQCCVNRRRNRIENGAVTNENTFM